MKKILTLMVAVFALVIGGVAQNHEGLSLLNVRALHTGTNTLGFTGVGGGPITNIAILATNAGSTWHTNIVFTNNAGQVVRSGGPGTNSISTFKIFNNVPLYADRDGKPIFSYIATDEKNAYSTNSRIFTPITLKIRLSNPLESNGVVGINFTPLWDGTNASLNTSDDWNVNFAYSLGVALDLVTNVPSWKWPGAKAFTVRNITNNFGPATPSATLVTNSPAITEMRVYGFRP